MTINYYAQQLVYPMSFFVLYIVIFMVLQYRMRVRAQKSGQMSFKFFYAYDASKYTPSDQVIVWRNHYDNTFQVPVLFMIGCMAHLVIGEANVWTVALAWAFVVSRIWHAIEHLGRNSLSWRPRIFFLGVLLVLSMYLQLCWFVAVQ